MSSDNAEAADQTAIAASSMKRLFRMPWFNHFFRRADATAHGQIEKNDCFTARSDRGDSALPPDL
jgi:hypothetical protein